MKWGSFTCEFEGEGGYSGQANRWVMTSETLAHGRRKDRSVEWRRIGWIMA
jgi:hypothetical protein